MRELWCSCLVKSCGSWRGCFRFSRNELSLFSFFLMETVTSELRLRETWMASTNELSSSSQVWLYIRNSLTQQNRNAESSKIAEQQFEHSCDAHSHAVDFSIDIRNSRQRWWSCAMMKLRKRMMKLMPLFCYADIFKVLHPLHCVINNVSYFYWSCR